MFSKTIFIRKKYKKYFLDKKTLTLAIFEQFLYIVV